MTSMSTSCFGPSGLQRALQTPLLPLPINIVASCPPRRARSTLSVYFRIRILRRLCRPTQTDSSICNILRHPFKIDPSHYLCKAVSRPQFGTPTAFTSQTCPSKVIPATSLVWEVGQHSDSNRCRCRCRCPSPQVSTPLLCPL